MQMRKSLENGGSKLGCANKDFADCAAHDTPREPTRVMPMNFIAALRDRSIASSDSQYSFRYLQGSGPSTASPPSSTCPRRRPAASGVSTFCSHLRGSAGGSLPERPHILLVRAFRVLVSEALCNGAREHIGSATGGVSNWRHACNHGLEGGTHPIPPTPTPRAVLHIACS